MGKRSDFERNPRDYYASPYEVVPPLLPYLTRGETFVEPCAGDGRLVRHLGKHGHRCAYACDVEPQDAIINNRDVLLFDAPLPQADLIITNPPWERDPLHRMIEIFRRQAPTWLLIDAGWMFTGQAKPHLIYCDLIVNIGRVSWMENGTSGMDDCCWYRFHHQISNTIFKP